MLNRKKKFDSIYLLNIYSYQNIMILFLCLFQYFCKAALSACFIQIIIKFVLIHIYLKIGINHIVNCLKYKYFVFIIF